MSSTDSTKPVTEIVTSVLSEQSTSLVSPTEVQPTAPVAVLAEWKRRRGVQEVTVRELMLQMLEAERYSRFEQGMNVIMDRFAEGDWRAIEYVTGQLEGKNVKYKPGKVIEQLPDPEDMTKRMRGKKE